MWIRNSEEEIQDFLQRQEAKKKSLLRPFLFALMLTVISVIIYSLGYRGGWLSGGIVLVSNPSGFSMTTVLVALFLFAFFFVFALYWMRRTSFHPSDNLLCRECKQPSQAGAAAVCECGGKLEPFEFFRWAEDEKPGEVHH